MIILNAIKQSLFSVPSAVTLAKSLVQANVTIAGKGKSFISSTL